MNRRYNRKLHIVQNYKWVRIDMYRLKRYRKEASKSAQQSLEAAQDQNKSAWYRLKLNSSLFSEI